MKSKKSQDVGGDIRSCKPNRFWELIVLACCTPLGMSAEDATSVNRNQVTALLELPDNKPSNESSAQTAQRLSSLKPSGDAHPKLQYAYLLTEMSLKRNSDALVTATDLVKHHESYLPGHCQRLRLLLHARRGDDALAEAEWITKHLTDKEALDAAGVLGLAIGYLEGAGANLVKVPSLNLQKDRIIATLKDDAQKLFLAQVRSVNDAYKVIVDRREQTDEERKEKAKDQLDNVSAEKDAVEAGRQKLQSQAEATREKIGSQAQSISAQYADLQNAYNRVSASQAALNTQLNFAFSDLAAIENQIAAEVERQRNRDRDRDRDRFPYDPGILARLDQQYWQVQRLVRNLNSQLAVGYAQQQSMMVTGRQLESQMRQVAGEGAPANQFFANQEQDLAKSQSQIQQAEKTLKASLKKAPRAPTLSERGFLRFDDFNFAVEKQKLLDSI